MSPRPRYLLSRKSATKINISRFRKGGGVQVIHDNVTKALIGYSMPLRIGDITYVEPMNVGTDSPDNMLPLGKFIEIGFKIPIDVGTDAKSNSPDNMLPLGKFIEDGFKIEMSDTALKITHPSDVQKI